MNTRSLIENAHRLGALEGQFVEWCIEAAGSKGLGRHPPVLFRQHGLGLLASRGFQAGEEVLRIPRSVWEPFSADHAIDMAKNQAPPLYKGLKALDDQTGMDNKLLSSMALATCLAVSLIETKEYGHLYCQLLNETSAAPHPLLVKPKALTLLFQASPIVKVTEKKRDMYASIHKAFFPSGSIMTLPDFLWGISRVLSRAIAGPDRPFTLVPYFDMMNHSASPTCAYEYDATQGDIVVKSIRSLAEKEEVTITYGVGKDNHELMSLYGFVDPANGNCISLTVSGEGAKAWIKAKKADYSVNDTQLRLGLLHQIGFQKNALQAFDWAIGGQTEAEEEEKLARAMAGFVILAVRDAKDLTKSGDDEGGLQAVKRILRHNDNAHHDATVAMKLCLQAQERQYSTSLEEDQIALESPVYSAAGPPDQFDDDEAKLLSLEKTALQLLIEEKSLLKKARDMVSEGKGKIIAQT